MLRPILLYLLFLFPSYMFLILIAFLLLSYLLYHFLLSITYFVFLIISFTTHHSAISPICTVISLLPPTQIHPLLSLALLPYPHLPAPPPLHSPIRSLSTQSWGRGCWGYSAANSVNHFSTSFVNPDGELLFCTFFLYFTFRFPNPWSDGRKTPTNPPTNFP